MEESPVTPKPQGNGLLVGLLAVIVILVGVVVYMALSSPTEMEEEVSTERQEVLTEDKEEIPEEEVAEVEDSTTVESDETTGTNEATDIDSDIQDLDEVDLGNIEDEYSESTIQDLE